MRDSQIQVLRFIYGTNVIGFTEREFRSAECGICRSRPFREEALRCVTENLLKVYSFTSGTSRPLRRRAGTGTDQTAQALTSEQSFDSRYTRRTTSSLSVCAFITARFWVNDIHSGLGNERSIQIFESMRIFAKQLQMSDL